MQVQLNVRAIYHLSIINFNLVISNGSEGYLLSIFSSTLIRKEQAKGLKRPNEK